MQTIDEAIGARSCGLVREAARKCDANRNAFSEGGFKQYFQGSRS
jgi:hypothetical protein